DIEKLVRKNIRTFVGERQAKLDPVGYAVFQNIKAVVAELYDLGILKRLDVATEPISGNSQFEIAGGQPGQFPDESALKTALSQTAALVDWLGAQTRVGRTAQELIANAIRLLPGQNIARFGLGTMKKALRALLDEVGIRPNFAREVSFSYL